ncbi:MAG: malto-oligosyltrehalose trehalohydrolase [Pirellulales bacterium]|nr:malto-oligosyltrehalose trehalohydrolase [Pirellulales bacterium]
MIGQAGQLRARTQGAWRDSHGLARWCVWAPLRKRVQLVLYDTANVGDTQRRTFDLNRADDGYWNLELDQVPAAARYAYLLDDESTEYPDPASRWQPEGVHRPSAIFSPEEFIWSDASWSGVERSDLVIYELHVGTFTPEGTFAAARARLPQLRELGVTAIELMPLSQFAGTRNWGYDGVHPYAVQHSYGGPRSLQQFIDAAHAAGLGVLIDVVYNHIGPEGNYFGQFGPYFTDHYRTPWGLALNYDGADSDPVRHFAIENACQWVRDFHADGLRLDAVQTIYDMSAKHLLQDLNDAVQATARDTVRTVVVIAETNQNDIRLVSPAEHGGYGLAGAWSDDFHHCVHALLTGERDGYYAGFGTRRQLAKSLADVYVYDGCYSPFHRRRHGNRVGSTPRAAFVTCIQNHDQIGNRALGDRLATLLAPPALRLAAGLLLLSPTTPLLFMGEEYGESNPFPFFCSFSDEQLIAAVRRGRREEFAALAFEWKIEIPDAQAPQSFESAKLSWDWRDENRAAIRRLYAELLALRRAWRQAEPHDALAAELVGDTADPVTLVARAHSGQFELWANLSERVALTPRSTPAGDLVPLLSTAAMKYAGQRTSLDDLAQLLPHELVAWGPSAWR